MKKNVHGNCLFFIVQRLSSEWRISCLQFASASSLPLETVSPPLDDHLDPPETHHTAETPTTPMLEAHSALRLEDAAQMSTTMLETVASTRRENQRKSTNDLTEAISTLGRVDSRDHVEKWIMTQSHVMEKEVEEEAKVEAEEADTVDAKTREKEGDK